MRRGARQMQLYTTDIRAKTRERSREALYTLTCRQLEHIYKCNKLSIVFHLYLCGRYSIMEANKWADHNRSITRKRYNVYNAIQPADPLLYDQADAVSIFELR